LLLPEVLRVESVLLSQPPLEGVDMECLSSQRIVTQLNSAPGSSGTPHRPMEHDFEGVGFDEVVGNAVPGLQLGPSSHQKVNPSRPMFPMRARPRLGVGT